MKWIFLNKHIIICASKYVLLLKIVMLKYFQFIAKMLLFLQTFIIAGLNISLYFFTLITEESFRISPCYSLELCIQMGISFLFSFAFSFSSFLSYSLGKTLLAFALLYSVPQGQNCLLLQASLDFLLLHSCPMIQRTSFFGVSSRRSFRSS